MNTKPKTAGVRLAKNNKSKKDDLYQVDREGDHQNLSYGAMSTYTIPRYILKGNGNFIGLGRQYRTDHRTGKPQGVSSADVDLGRKQREQYMLAIPSPRVGELLSSATCEGGEVALQQDYISLHEKHSRQRGRPSRASFDKIPYSSSESSDSNEWSENDSKSQLSSEDAAYEAFRNDPTRKRHNDLLKTSVQYPEQIENWLALVAYQENIYDALSMDQGLDDPLRERRIADLKISIYESALSKVHDQTDRDRLIIGLLKQGTKVWDIPRQTAEWQRYIKVEPSLDLSISYASFIQSNIVTFSLDLCLNFYVQQLGKFSAQPASEDRDLQLLYLLLRVSICLLQAGFVERAVAIWQVVLELNLTATRFTDFSEELAAFETFWDSGKFRIGEPGLTGWWFERHDQSASSADPHRLLIDEQNLFPSWAVAEKKAVISAGLPSRPLDDLDENDPFRVVMFSDVANLSFKISSSQSHPALINAFLTFCGLPPFSTDSKVTNWIRRDAFISRAYILPQPGADEKTLDIIDNVILDFQPSTWILFAPSNRPYHVWLKQLSFRDHLDHGWVQQTLQQLASTYWNNERFATYVVAVLLSIQPNLARKFAKSLLKRNPDSLRLYNAYACVENRLSNTASAERIWSTALDMAGSLDEHGKTPAILLWHTWIWECIDTKQFSKAEMLLSKVADGKIDKDHLNHNSTEHLITPVQRLRAERFLESHMSLAVSPQHQEAIPMYTDLLALMRYLQADKRLSSALAVYSNVIKSIVLSQVPEISSVLEDLHQSRARFLYAHVEIFKTGFRLREVLNTIEESLAAYPQNSLFLDFHQRYQKKAGILHNIHNEKFDTSSLSSLGASIHTIKAAFERPAFSGRTEHSIRAAFFKATRFGSPARHCPMIWKAFICWEVSLMSEELSNLSKSKSSFGAKAKEAFHHAVQACPWVKEIYMLAFAEKQIRQILGEEALKGLYQSMLDRGIRIHIDIADMLPK